jgi:HEAT repeat protein
MSASPRSKQPSRPARRPGRRAAALAAAACLTCAAIAFSFLFVARRPEPAAPIAPARVPSATAPASPSVERSEEPRKPLADAVREHWQRKRASASAPDADALPGLIQLALDPRAQFAERAKAVSALALSPDESAFAALERLLAEGSPFEAFVAEALGGSPHPRAVPLLVGLAGSSSETVALGALRGLARAGGAQATAALAATLADAERSQLVRSQAAHALGALDTPEARSALRDALAAAPNAELAGSLLEGLGAQPFAETAEIFTALLASPDAPLAHKLRALDALAMSSPDASALLLETAASAPQPQLRARALQSLALLEGSDGAGPLLIPLLGTEASPEVRAEIYDALAFTTDELPARADATLLPAVLAETDPTARLSGYRWVASRIGSGGDPALASAFDERMLPWLRETAREGGGSHPRLAAVDTLALAATPEALAELARLAREPDPVLAQAAEKAQKRAQRRLAATATPTLEAD